MKDERVNRHPSYRIKSQIQLLGSKQASQPLNQAKGHTNKLIKHNGTEYGTYPQLAASTMAIQNASVSDVLRKMSPWTRT